MFNSTTQKVLPSSYQGAGNRASRNWHMWCWGCIGSCWAASKIHSNTGTLRLGCNPPNTWAYGSHFVDILCMHVDLRRDVWWGVWYMVRYTSIKGMVCAILVSESTCGLWYVTNIIYIYILYTVYIQIHHMCIVPNIFNILCRCNILFFWRTKRWPDQTPLLILSQKIQSMPKKCFLS